MPDEIDQRLDRDIIFEEITKQEIARRAAAIPVGEPGECELCGWDSPRLVNGACAPCRDKHKLP